MFTFPPSASYFLSKQQLVAESQCKCAGSCHTCPVGTVHGLCFHSRFYAGGSERSGQQIVGPPRKKSPNELVEDLFKGAKEHGAVAVDRTAKSSGESSKPKVRSDEFFLLFSLSLLELSVCGSHCDSWLVLWSTKTNLKEHLSLDSCVIAALISMSWW